MTAFVHDSVSMVRANPKAPMTKKSINGLPSVDHYATLFHCLYSL